MKTTLIGEYRQLDGWHPARVFRTGPEAMEWCNRVDEARGNHHGRRYRRVRTGSLAANAAYDAEQAEFELRQER